MKCSLFLPLLLLLASFPAFASVYEEVTDEPRRSGGIYYTYPVESDTAPSPASTPGPPSAPTSSPA